MNQGYNLVKITVLYIFLHHTLFSSKSKFFFNILATAFLPGGHMKVWSTVGGWSYYHILVVMQLSPEGVSLPLFAWKLLLLLFPKLFSCSAIPPTDWMVSWPHEPRLPRMCEKYHFFPHNYVFANSAFKVRNFHSKTRWAGQNSYVLFLLKNGLIITRFDILTF